MFINYLICSLGGLLIGFVVETYFSRKREYEIHEFYDSKLEDMQEMLYERNKKLNEK